MCRMTVQFITKVLYDSDWCVEWQFNSSPKFSMTVIDVSNDSSIHHQSSLWQWLMCRMTVQFITKVLYDSDWCVEWQFNSSPKFSMTVIDVSNDSSIHHQSSLWQWLMCRMTVQFITKVLYDSDWCVEWQFNSSPKFSMTLIDV